MQAFPGPPPTASGQATVSLSLSGMTVPLLVWQVFTHCLACGNTRYTLRCTVIIYTATIIVGASLKLLLALRLRRRVEKQGGRGQLNPLVPHLPFTCVFQSPSPLHPCVFLASLVAGTVSRPRGACTSSPASPSTVSTLCSLYVGYHGASLNYKARPSSL